MTLWQHWSWWSKSGKTKLSFRRSRDFTIRSRSFASSPYTSQALRLGTQGVEACLGLSGAQRWMSSCGVDSLSGDKNSSVRRRLCVWAHSLSQGVDLVYHFQIHLGQVLGTLTSLRFSWLTSLLPRYLTLQRDQLWYANSLRSQAKKGWPFPIGCWFFINDSWS